MKMKRESAIVPWLLFAAFLVLNAIGILENKEFQSYESAPCRTAGCGE
jgi:hypothetical protein